MQHIPTTKKRLIKAIDGYLKYADKIKEIGANRYTINNGSETYVIDMNLFTCTCVDNQYHGFEAPCKHIIMVFLYRYFMMKQELEELPL